MKGSFGVAFPVLLVLLGALVQQGTCAPPARNRRAEQQDAPLIGRNPPRVKADEQQAIDGSAAHSALGPSAVVVSSAPPGFTVAPSAECSSSDHGSYDAERGETLSVHPTPGSHMMPSPTHHPAPEPSSHEPLPSSTAWDSDVFPSASDRPEPPASSAHPEPSTAAWSPSVAPHSKEHSDLAPSASNHPEPPASTAIGPHSDFPSHVMRSPSIHPQPSTADWNPTAAPHSREHSDAMPSASNHPEPPASSAAWNPTAAPHSHDHSGMMPSASNHPEPPASTAAHQPSVEHVRPTASQPPMPNPSASHGHHIHPTPSQSMGLQSVGTEETPSHAGKHHKDKSRIDTIQIAGRSLVIMILILALLPIAFILYYGRHKIKGAVKHAWDKTGNQKSEAWYYTKLTNS